MKLIGLSRFLALVLALVLVSGQWAGQMHALSHAKQELTAALNGHSASQVARAAGGKHNAPGQDHSRDRCVAFQAIDSAAVTPATPLLVQTPPSFTVELQQIALLPAEPAPYSSRAPPFSPS